MEVLKESQEKDLHIIVASIVRTSIFSIDINIKYII